VTACVGACSAGADAIMSLAMSGELEETIRSYFPEVPCNRRTYSQQSSTSACRRLDEREGAQHAVNDRAVNGHAVNSHIDHAASERDQHAADGGIAEGDPRHEGRRLSASSAARSGTDSVTPPLHIADFLGLVLIWVALSVCSVVWVYLPASWTRREQRLRHTLSKQLRFGRHLRRAGTNTLDATTVASALARANVGANSAGESVELEEPTWKRDSKRVAALDANDEAGLMRELLRQFADLRSQLESNSARAASQAPPHAASLDSSSDESARVQVLQVRDAVLKTSDGAHSFSEKGSGAGELSLVVPSSSSHPAVRGGTKSARDIVI
jgi:hypothetical protein